MSVRSKYTSKKRLESTTQRIPKSLLKSLTSGEIGYLKQLKYENRRTYKDSQAWIVNTKLHADTIAKIMRQRGYKVTVERKVPHGFVQYHISAKRGY